MQIETRLSDALGRYLDLAVGETKLTAANMANIDTPGYRTQGFDFETEMRTALGTLDGQGSQLIHAQDDHQRSQYHYFRKCDSRPGCFCNCDRFADL